MRSPAQVIFIIAAFILLTIAAPRMLLASDIELIVNNAAGAACSTTATPACYTTIQGAIDYANNVITQNTTTTVTYSILVEPGTYTETITLKPGVSVLRGRETARTILQSGGSAPVVTAANLTTAVSFRNFSIFNSAAGISVSSSSAAITITNNVFYGISGTAVTVQASTSTNVINNTFYQNGTAVSRDSESNQITNNIFSNNTVNINQSTLVSQTNITYNDYNPAPASGTITDQHSIPNQTITNPDPLFADISDGSRLNFHLKTGSPCIGNGDSTKGTPNDMGAYGGSNTDTIPMQVSNVTAEQGADPSSISVKWNQDLDYKVTGYRVYYGKTSGGPYNGTDATGGNPSPISVPTGTAASTYTLSGLTTTVSTPASPVLNQPSPLNESLVLSWSAVDNATKYKIYYSESSFDMSSLSTTTAVDAGNKTSNTLSGLTNGTTYYIAVSAISEAIYYIAVTAIYATDGTPGISNESIYSTEVPVPTGESKESAISEVKSDFPEAVVPYPDLPNGHQGCFIATAAYGYYSAPEVQALRAFRDQYLLTSRAGSAFVRWYYEYGPVAAAYLDAHPGFKPVVRATLMPAVGMAVFMTKTSLIVKVMVLLVIGPAIAFGFYINRRRQVRRGGLH